MKLGDQATFDATQLDATAVAPTGLTDGSTYYMIYVDANTVEVAANLSDANAGNAINLTASGSGSMSSKVLLQLLPSLSQVVWLMV